MVRTNPPKKLLWLIFCSVSGSAIEGQSCSMSQNFRHQNKQAQVACNTGISIFFPFTLLNNWSTAISWNSNIQYKTRNYHKLHVFQDVFPSQISQPFSAESQIYYIMTLFHSHPDTSQCQQPHLANDCKRFTLSLKEWLAKQWKRQKNSVKWHSLSPQKATSEGRKEGRQLDLIH